MAHRRSHGRPLAAGAWAARALVQLAVILPALAGALEPRFDHRDQQGPTVEALVVKDVLWSGSSEATSSVRGAVRFAWGFDPTGDGDELFFGATLMAVEGASSGGDPLRLTLDTRYRICVGTEEFKTLLDLGIWGSVADTVVVGPLVGLGFIYDFSRDFGMFTSAFVAVGIGQGRVFSLGGGVGVQYRFE